MGIIRWLKIQWILPRLNKAEKKVAYHKREIKRYAEQKNLSGRDRYKQKASESLVLSWGYELEKLQDQLERARRS
jgi:hypothetical protein